MGHSNHRSSLDDLRSDAINLVTGSHAVGTIFGTGLLLILGGACLARGLFKLRRAKELESDARFRRIAHQIRWVGWFLLLSAAACAVAVFAAIRTLF